LTIFLSKILERKKLSPPKIDPVYPGDNLIKIMNGYLKNGAVSLTVGV
jgi:hypothetical protein